MGRRPRNTLPTARALLEPMNYDPLRVKHQLDKTKHAQKFYHDRKRAGRPRTWRGVEARHSAETVNTSAPALQPPTGHAMCGVMMNSGMSGRRQQCQRSNNPLQPPLNSTLHLVDLQHNRRYPSAPHKPQVNSILLDGAES
ncbi:hypothetical protein SKAU_G00075130 [Synaphobranchus kaupii]|uniref:Uncharacterized protein n=1 Tax=Synaphobranchus kaupii TaxID=118154 RepID=A0A9Q1G8H0_SYNKA|nr:hypothetical protein SKAU_G00075130 [Synaphobranchus kaupii]